MAEALLVRGDEPICVGRSASPETVPDGAVPLAGDVCDPDFLRAAVDGVDAVVAALSIPRKSRSPFAAVVGPEDLHSRSTRMLLEVYDGRLLKVSAQSVGESAPRAGWGFRTLVAVSNLRPAFADHAVADALVQDSGLAWTIVRPPILAEGRRGPLRAAEDVVTWSWTKVGIVDLAEWIAEALTDASLEGRTVSLGPA